MSVWGIAAMLWAMPDAASWAISSLLASGYGLVQFQLGTKGVRLVKACGHCFQRGLVSASHQNAGFVQPELGRRPLG